MATRSRSAVPAVQRPLPARAAPAPGARSPRSTLGRARAEAPASPVAADTPESRIYRAIFESVMDQRLLPGTKLTESALGELFGASRSVVRQALQRLAHEHIVQLRPNRGAIVAVPTREDMQHIFEARRTLEGTLVRLAAQRATQEDVALLRAQLHDESEAMHRFDQPAWARLASRFHLTVCRLGRNPILQGYLEEIVSRCSLIVALYQPPGNACCEHDEHEAIVQSIARGDADEAARLTEAHLRALEQSVCLHCAAPAPGLKELLGL